MRARSNPSPQPKRPLLPPGFQADLASSPALTSCGHSRRLTTAEVGKAPLVVLCFGERGSRPPSAASATASAAGDGWVPGPPASTQSGSSGLATTVGPARRAPARRAGAGPARYYKVSEHTEEDARGRSGSIAQPMARARLSTVDGLSINLSSNSRDRQARHAHQAHVRSANAAADAPFDVERPAVNRRVTGSSPVGGATSSPMFPGEVASPRSSEVDQCQRPCRIWRGEEPRDGNGHGGTPPLPRRSRR